MALQETRLLELRQHPVNRGEADVHAFREEGPIDVFRRHVADAALFEQFQNFQPGKVAFSPMFLRLCGSLIVVLPVGQGLGPGGFRMIVRFGPVEELLRTPP